MRSRRTPLPPTWLSRVEDAGAAFTGTAEVVSDTQVPATKTAFRGAGFAVGAEITSDTTIFGAAPDPRVLLRGETPLPPERRVDPAGPRFPPDSLREVPYWDQARPGVAVPVLCLTADPPVVRALLGPDDDLPEAVALIRSWLDSGADQAGVERDLTERGASPVAWVAGFELLLRASTDVAELSARFLRLPGCPGAGTRGVLSLLRRHAGQLADDGVAALARRLLDVVADETDPEALVAHLSWLEVEHDRIIAANATLAGAVRTVADRATSRRFDGPDSEAWSGELARFASALTDRE